MAQFRTNDTVCRAYRCMHEQFGETHNQQKGATLSKGLYEDSITDQQASRNADNLVPVVSEIANRNSGLMGKGDTHYLTVLDHGAAHAEVFRGKGCLTNHTKKSCEDLNRTRSANFIGQDRDDDPFEWHNGACCAADKVRGHGRELTVIR